VADCVTRIDDAGRGSGSEIVTERTARVKPRKRVVTSHRAADFCLAELVYRPGCYEEEHRALLAYVADRLLKTGQRVEDIVDHGDHRDQWQALPPVRACPRCGSSWVARILFSQRFRTPVHGWMRCDHCGHLFLPDPTEAASQTPGSRVQARWADGLS
jgi:rubredoxin